MTRFAQRFRIPVRMHSSTSMWSSIGSKLKNIAKASYEHKNAFGEILLWLVVGSLAMELKWQRKQLEEIELDHEAKAKRLKFEILELKGVDVIAGPADRINSVGLY